MKKIIMLFLLCSFCASIDAQVKETISENRAAFLGVKNKKDFLQAPYSTWFYKSFDNYTLNKKSIKKLKDYKDGLSIKVFMSVWCHDSKREIPRLYKILEAIDFDESNLEVVALNRVKKTPENLQEGYNIIRTPTIIFYKNGVETGRFVEHPRQILEKDILKIVSGRPYKHSYEDGVPKKAVKH